MPGVLQQGDKLLVSHRRLFERDELRYFAGTVVQYEAGVVKVEGWTFLKDFGSGRIMRKPDVRTKLYSLASGMILVYQLPNESDLTTLEFIGDAAHVVLKDDRGLEMDVSEHAAAGEGNSGSPGLRTST